MTNLTNLTKQNTPQMFNIHNGLKELVHKCCDTTEQQGYAGTYNRTMRGRGLLVKKPRPLSFQVEGEADT